MFREINKGMSITKILINSAILTWFTVILIENWRNMRISWFKEVWEFVDFKAIGHYIEDHLGIYVVFGAAIILIYKVLSMFASAERDEGVPSSEYFEQDDSYAEFMDKIRAKWEEDLINNPAYHGFPRNRKMNRNDEDQ